MNRSGFKDFDTLCRSKCVGESYNKLSNTFMIWITDTLMGQNVTGSGKQKVSCLKYNQTYIHRERKPVSNTCKLQKQGGV